MRRQLVEVKTKGEKSIKRDVLIEQAKMSRLNDRQQKILLYLLDEKQASVEEIRQKFNLVRRAVQRDLSRLVDSGMINEVAKSKTDPTKYYELL